MSVHADFDDPSDEDVERFGGETFPCPNCGEEIYDDSPFCPRCGEVGPEDGGVTRAGQFRASGAMLAIGLLALLGFILVFVL